ncbi:UDP-N-acetylmuramoyl-L-alanine--D-glutamate ligase [Candidatus Saccharibacteria bacterium]|nr:UDP-N-acetylmuramoyl-L-alanine--D-glutamate ligase [Candidatus Saccharibacteria bacterium]
MKIAILGYGIEGKSAERYCQMHYKNAEIKIFDNVPDNVKADGFDLVFRTPSIAPIRIKTDGQITSVTQEFFDKCPAPIIGVTGTKGKGTVCSLIAAILKAAGKTVHLVGNIGLPALDELPKINKTDIVVYELSSFQLWDLKRKSPQTAVVLHIEPDHLDRHANFDEYVAAKANIVKYQSAQDTVIFDNANQDAINIAKQSKAAKMPYPNSQFAHIVLRHPELGSGSKSDFYYGEHIICSTSVLKIPGIHNQMNALAAIDAVSEYTLDPEVIEQGLGSFTGLPHRLKFVTSKNGVDYYDDSISTTPGSTIAAIKAFTQPKVVILGGSSKGANFTELAATIQQSNVKNVILIGPEGQKIKQALNKIGYKNYEDLGKDYNMQQVVTTAIALAKKGDVVLLSPAAASFDKFASYSDRGDQFIAKVMA